MAEQVQSVPGVQSIATASAAPQMFTMFFPFAIAGKTNPNEVPQAWFNSVSPTYFRVLGITTVAGREFTDHDRAGSGYVVIINETLQRRYFAQEDPIGKHVTVNYLNTPLTLEVVGVVKDIKQDSLHAPANAQIYVSALQLPWFSTSLMIRTDADPATVVSSVQRAVHSVDSTQSGSAAKTMDALLSDSVAQPRFYSLLLSFFAALALILASVGVYGVVAYAVAQRTHEFGIRIALGAQVSDVLKLVIGRGMLLVLAGAALGLGAAFLLTRLLKEFLFGVTATDPWTFVATALLLAAVAVLAIYIPARRATKVDPLVALRYE
jgi:putative ABC transport system permease protein